MCDFGGRVLSRATKYVILFYYHSYDGNANQGLGKAKLGIGLTGMDANIPPLDTGSTGEFRY